MSRAFAYLRVSTIGQATDNQLQEIRAAGFGIEPRRVVTGTVSGIGVRVHCLALGGVDLASSTGKLTMGVINAVAEFEHDLLVERTRAGLSRAKAEGKRLGRPASLTAEQRRSVLRRLGEGAAVSALAREFKTSRQTILRVRDGTPAS